MKVASIIGARPQFIKAAVVSRPLRKVAEEVLIHTGQHFDYNMSEQFFEELGLPHPAYNLGISGGTHASMTASMLVAIEETLVKEKPDVVLLYGDTNTTLSGALAAAKLHIPIAHVEAGYRTRCLSNPEEINRVCTDHVSSLLLAVTEECKNNLEAEGLGSRALFVGDPMFDAFVHYRKAALEMRHRLLSFDGEEHAIPFEYYYLTCHREENTTDDATLGKILSAMEQLDAPVVYPVHPRNRVRVERLCAQFGYANTLFVNPVGYLTSIALVSGAKKVVTDSGGLQREAFFAEKKCVTVLPFVVIPESMVDGRNTLSSPEPEDILNALSENQVINDSYKPFGDGRSAEKIVEALLGFQLER